MTQSPNTVSSSAANVAPPAPVLPCADGGIFPHSHSRWSPPAGSDAAAPIASPIEGRTYSQIIAEHADSLCDSARAMTGRGGVTRMRGRAYIARHAQIAAELAEALRG